MKDGNFPSYEDVQKVRQKLSDVGFEHWIHDDFLKWEWWSLLGLSIVPWLIWWKLSDKTRRQEILLYGCIIAILTVFLDNIGTEQLWWGYPDKLLHMLPPLFPPDYTLVPVFMMLAYQYFPKFKSFFIANVILGLFMAYVGEPIFIWLDFYQLNEWKLFYSFIYYMFSAMVARWIVIKTRN